MSQPQQLFLARVNHEKEVKLLTAQLTQQAEVIQAQEARIAQLSESLKQSSRAPYLTNELNQEQTQCYLAKEQQLQQSSRLSEVLRARENEAINLHLAIEQKQMEAQSIKRKLRQKEEQLRDLRLLNKQMEKQLLMSIQQCHQLKAEIRNQEEISRFGNQVKEEDLQRQQQELKKLYAEINDLKGREARLHEERQSQKIFIQQLKEAANTKDWKLFCIQTELDLRLKQCRGLKDKNEEQAHRIHQLEIILKEKQIMIFSEEEQNNLLKQEMQSLSTELKRKQHKVDQIRAQFNRILQETEREKQQSMANLILVLKEKEDQLNNLNVFLKKKQSQLQELKLDVATSKKKQQELTRQKQRLSNQNYELEQSIIEHEQIMERQSQRINTLQEHIQAINRRISEAALLQIIKKQEQTQLKAEMKAQAARQTQKINRLTIQIIQRDIAAKRSNQHLAELQKSLEQSNQYYRNTAIKLQKAEGEAAARLAEDKARESEALELKNKIKCLQDNNGKIQTTILSLRERVSTLGSENLRLNQALRDKKMQISQLKGQNSYLDGSVKVLKGELDSKVQQNQRLNQKIYNSNTKIEQLELIIERMRIKLSNLNEQQVQLLQLGKKFIENIDNLYYQDVDSEETTQFEILSQQFQAKPLQGDHKIKRIVEEFNSKFKALTDQTL